MGSMRHHFCILKIVLLFYTIQNKSSTDMRRNIHAKIMHTCMKMTHEKQLYLGNIKSKVNETCCYCETCTIRLKCGRGCGTERIQGADVERIWITCGTDMGIKCVILMSFFASFLRFCVFDLCYFVMYATLY